MKNQLNLNTILIAFVGALMAFGLKKLDAINTQTITLGVSQAAMVQRLERLEAGQREFVLRQEMRGEIERLEREIGEQPDGRVRSEGTKGRGAERLLDRP